MVSEVRSSVLWVKGRDESLRKLRWYRDDDKTRKLEQKRVCVLELQIEMNTG